MPEPRFSTADAGHRHLVRARRSISTDDASVRHELRTLFRLARHLQRRDEIGDAVERADLDDLELLLGARPHEGESRPVRSAS